VPAPGWSTQQLTEFLAAIGTATSRAAAMRLAAERVAEAVEAEVVAILIRGRVAAQVGFPPEGAPRGLLQRIAAGEDPIGIDGLGRCRTAAGRLGDDDDMRVVVARAGDDPLTGEERALLRGMARVLNLSLGNLRLLQRERGARRASQRQAAEIRERQRLLEELSIVQRMIVDRAPLQEILDVIVASIARLVGDELVGLRLLDPEMLGVLRMVASHGIPLDTYREVEKGAVGAGAGGMALEEDRLVVIEDYRDHSSALPGLTKLGVRSAAAAPIRQDGKPVGSLVIASTVAGRRYRDTERAALIAFAEHASLAVSDAGRTRQMLHSALHDALTGLPNRLLFSDRLDQRLVGGRRTRPPTAVLFLDVDALKRINDSLGHLVGDEVLVETARRLSATVRTEDTVARLAGDEFTVLLDEITGESEALAVAGRLLEAVRQPIEAGGRRLSLTASIGVRLARAGVDRAADVMRGADLAMYEAKARGGGAVALFHRDLDQRAVRRLELEGELRAAMEVGEFRVLYQPIVALPSGRIQGVEALVRWDRGERGLVSPAEFIPMAEETGLIVELGAWVLGEACRTVVGLDSETGVALTLSVNLSARQLLEPGLEATVVSALSGSGLRPGRLTLEITESVLMADTTATINRLASLRGLGVRVAIDDFGTGYSSLGYLRRLPLDAVKIDRSFIEDVTDGTRQAALVHAIVELCRTLELDTVAEGVETNEQAVRLTELGCELAQGFLFGRPMPAKDIARRLATWARQKPAVVPSDARLVAATGSNHRLTPAERLALFPPMSPIPGGSSCRPRRSRPA
jgi:diguanylate cyclase (GGDEF)-like protein